MAMCWAYTVTKLALHASGLVQKAAGSVRRTARSVHAGRFGGCCCIRTGRAMSGSKVCRDGPDRYAGRCDERDLLDAAVEEEGTASTFQALAR